MKIVIVGSGPSAVAAATALVEHDCDIEMLDFGNEKEDKAEELSSRLMTQEITEPDLNLLKRGFQKSNHYNSSILEEISSSFKYIFKSEDSKGLSKKRQFGSTFTYENTDEYVRLTKNSPQYHRSLAKGGLSNVWGAACYPFSEEDFKDWPISKSEMDPHYLAVNDILQLNESNSTLSNVYSVYKPKEMNIQLNPQSLDLLNKWSQSKDRLSKSGFFFGQSHLAVLTQNKNGRSACQYCGLCLYGCPHGSIYSSTFTIDALKEHNNFHYRSGCFLRRFKELENGKVSLEVEDPRSKRISHIECDKLFIGTGILSTLRIVADSFRIYPDDISILNNELFLLPLVKLSNWMDFDKEVKFTLSQLALVIRDKSICDEIIHTQLYSYSDYVFDRFSPFIDLFPKTIKKIIQKLMFNTFIMFVYLHSRYSAKLNAKIIRAGNGAISSIDINYQRNPYSNIIVNRMIKSLKLNRRWLYLYPIKLALKNAGEVANHMSGTLPMREKPDLFETYSNGLLHGTKSVYIVDQSTFPSLPAQNITYTAMANAHRIATQFGKVLN